MLKICSKPTLKKTERRKQRRFGFFIVNFERKINTRYILTLQLSPSRCSSVINCITFEFLRFIDLSTHAG